MLDFFTNKLNTLNPPVWCVPQKVEQCILSYVEGIYLLDNRKNVLLLSCDRYAFSVVPLIETNVLQRVVHKGNKNNNEPLKRQISYLQIVENQQQPVVTINSIEASFNQFYEEWNKEIKYQSSTDVMLESDYFKKIVALGKEVVPYIIEILKKTPSFLIIALLQITGENPVKPAHCGKIKEMTRDWMEWWDRRYSTLD
jgi:hypothetical protein